LLDSGGNNDQRINRNCGPPAVFACAADSAYAMPLAAMLQSLSAHADPERRLEVYIVDCGLSSSMRERIQAQSQPHLQIHWRPSIRPSGIDDPTWGHVSRATSARLLLQDYVPGDTSLVLWLDCDLLVLDDITTLFEPPTAGHILRAVRDPLVQTMGSRFGVRQWREVGLGPDTAYFNAGVMLIDMFRWRAADVAGRAKHYLRHYRRQVFFHEQEALNAVVGNRWERLGDRWNYSANPMHAKAQDLVGGAPAIIHFTGRTKPWNLPALGAAQELFFRHLDETSWRGQRPDGGVKNRLLSWYVGSRFRHLTYPLENMRLQLYHYLGM